MRIRKTIFASVAAMAGLLAVPGDRVRADDLLKAPWEEIVSAAKNEGQLTFYAWWGAEFWRTTGNAFEAEYGVKVDVFTGDRMANIGKVLAEAASETGTIDALLVGGVELKSLLDANALFGPLAPTIPGSDKLDPKLLEVQEGYATGGYLIPVYRNQAGLLYDPQKVPSPPQSWREFTAWLDANPGQFAFNDPSRGGSGQAFVQAAIANILGNEEAYAGDTELDRSEIVDWPKVWDWFNANEDKFTITASNNDSIDRVNQGEVAMTAAWDDDTAVALSRGTLFKRAKLYVPAFGLPGGGDSLGIPANAPNKAAAMLFLAYLVRAEVQQKLNATIGSSPARTDLAGVNTLIPEEQRKQNSRPWLPGVYKGLLIRQFVSDVLQK